MKQDAKAYLSEISSQEKRFAALYRQAAAGFDLSECAMWVLYFLITADEPLTQQDLIERMQFPKQTINSAVSGLAQKGSVELQMIPGTRNRKNILLTSSGAELAGGTVRRMRAAEECAAKKLGAEKMARYIALHEEFLGALREEFGKEGIIGGASE